MPLHYRPIDHRAQSGILCGLLLRRSRSRSRFVAVAACCLDLFFSIASSSSICCCRHSSLQNGVSPLHAHPHGGASIATTGFLLARIVYLHMPARVLASHVQNSTGPYKILSLYLLHIVMSPNIYNDMSLYLMNMKLLVYTHVNGPKASGSHRRNSPKSSIYKAY